MIGARQRLHVQITGLSRLESSLIFSVARTDREVLRGPADKAMKVVEHRFGEATAVWAETGSRIQTDPFAYRLAQKIDCQIQIEKTVPGIIENCANAVARIRGDSNALVCARFWLGANRADFLGSQYQSIKLNIYCN